MTLDMVTDYLQLYGYWVIVFVLFCGIVGIPAPEETFMIFIGGIVAQHHLDFYRTVIAAMIGANLGMIIAYFIGRNFGSPFIFRYGRYLKITPEKWHQMQNKFMKFDRKVVLLAYFFPGLRQLSPYISGVRQLSFHTFLGFSFLGSSLWVILFTTIGYYFGDIIGLKYLSLLALCGFIIFMGGAVWKYWMTGQKNKVSS